MAEKKIRLILADDHVLVRKGIRQFLEEAGNIEILGEAGNGAEALQLIEKLQPDVAVLDVRMPQMSGVEAARIIKSRFPAVKVLILTAYDDDPHIFTLLQTGVDGYLLKTADPDELIRAVETVYRGDSVLSPEITHTVMRQMAKGKPGQAPDQLETLTDRELEVLRLAAQGLTNKAIGAALSISHRTVQGHLENIFSKLHVASRTEAVTEGLRRGWIVME